MGSLENRRLCQGIVKRLTVKKSAQPFKYPVKLSGYTDIIKKPMDLSTIKSKLSKKKYKSVAGFITDMRLIVSNCLLYNLTQDESYPVRDYAYQLRAAFDNEL